ncbi:MAG: DUF418 domain-containing protein [Proteobacteria bacterium]|nr:DUF418 domain-containing protein [Pseudomonadota bacterium]
MSKRSMSTPPAPVSVAERLPLLDAIRGVALAGILLANLTSFFGVHVMDAAVRRSMVWSEIGDSVLFGIDWLVEGKFYSVFSILLGIGFALQRQRAAAVGVGVDQFARFFRRRMAILVGFGLVHMVALWSGDILVLYGLMGLLLPTFARLGTRPRAGLITVLLAAPLLTHLAVVASAGNADPRRPFAEAAAQVRERFGVGGRPTLELLASESSADYRAWNVANAVVRPGTYLQSGRPTKVLALFLIGAWLGFGVLTRLDTLGRSLRVTAAAGGVVGLSASYVYADIKADTGSTFMVSSTGLIQTVAYTLGTTPLALAYLALAVLACRATLTRQWLHWFVPLGRMALTVYITQTAVQLVAFTGYGFALAGRTPIALLPLFAISILSAQRYACAWWLGRNARGPLEALWRRWTYSDRGRQRSQPPRSPRD